MEGNMKTPGKRYLILAIAGALILGIGSYILLNNFFEKVEIIAASHDIGKNKTIEEKDLIKIQYYKNSLPKGYITDLTQAVGKVLLVERKSGDPITSFVFEETNEIKPIEALKEGELLLALNVNYVEPVIDDLLVGSRISICSTEKDNDYNMLDRAYNSYSESTYYSTSGQEIVRNFQEQDLNFNKEKEKIIKNQAFLTDKAEFLEKSIYSLSENIMVIDGQIVIKNIEVINIKKLKNEKNVSLAGSSKENYFIYVKCNIEEAPIISRVTKDGDYKILLQKS